MSPVQVQPEQAAVNVPAVPYNQQHVGWNQETDWYFGPHASEDENHHENGDNNNLMLEAEFEEYRRRDEQTRTFEDLKGGQVTDRKSRKVSGNDDCKKLKGRTCPTNQSSGSN